MAPTSAPPLASAPPPGAEPGLPAVSAVQASKVHGWGDTAVTALDGVDLALPAARFTAIMGPSGSGKSTLMHCMAGLDSLTGGQVFIGGTDLSRLSDKELTLLRRRRIGFVFQSFNLIPTLTAVENITLPLDLSGDAADDGWLREVVATVGLTSRVDHLPSELSGGQQQRVAVARALVTRPDIVFADEPTGNLDSQAGAEILEFLSGAVRDLGQSVVMVTHDPVAAGYADTALFLADGRLVDRIEAPTAERVLDRIRVSADGRVPVRTTSEQTGA